RYRQGIFHKNRKPVGSGTAWEIDWSAPLAQGLTCYLLLNDGNRSPEDLVIGRSFAKNTAFNLKAGIVGLGAVGNAADTGSAQFSGAAILTADGGGTGDFSMACQFQAAAGAAIEQLFNQRDNTNNLECGLVLNALISGSLSANSGDVGFYTQS